MSNLKLSGMAIAAAMISAVPSFAQDNADWDGRPRLVFIQVEDHNSTTTNMLIEVHRKAAARICGDDFSRLDRVACTISVEDARQAGLIGGDDRDEDDDEYVDANHGHGNDPDGFDEDNPGLGHGNNGHKANGHGGGNH